MNRCHYIYALRKPNGEIFYFGRTKNLQHRKNNHIQEARSRGFGRTSTPTLDMIGSLLGTNGFELDVLAWTTDGDLAKRMERHLITEHVGNLTNMYMRPGVKLIKRPYHQRKNKS